MTVPRSELDVLYTTVDEIRDMAHTLGARHLVATMPTFDGEAEIDYRQGDWLKVTVAGRCFVLPPDWSATCDTS